MRTLFSVFLFALPLTAMAGPAETYTAMCAACHGAKGAADGPAGAALPVKPANFASPEYWKGKSDEEVAKVIKEGGAAAGKSPLMAPFGAMFDEAALKEMVKYLHTLEKKAE
jgi:mono/diheme cytochrome c family protein